MFEKLQISNCSSYREHLNQYDVLKLNMQDFLSMTHNVSDMLNLLQTRIVSELKRKYQDHIIDEPLIFAMQDNFFAYRKTVCYFD